MYFNYNSSIKINVLKSFFRENSDSLFITSSFCFKNTYFSEKFFKFYNFYNIYSRFSNPTLFLLEKKISFLENFKFCLTLTSGMAAIFSIFINFLNSNQYFFSSLNIFGSTINFFLNLLFKFKITVLFVNLINFNSLKYNIFKINLIFFESLSNPNLKLFNLKLVSYLCKKYKIIQFIDNTFTPLILNSYLYNIDFIAHSCTKFFDGQGRILGGALLTNNRDLFLNIFNFLKFSGFSLSSFDSWLILKSLENIFVRLKNQIFNSFFLIKLFKYNLFISKIFYSGVLNYFQYKIFYFQQIFSNSIISFSIKSNTIEMRRLNSWKIINNSFISNTANLGDLSSIFNNCSITTHSFLSFIEKSILNIDESLIRLSVGLEDIFDIFYNIIFSFNNI